MRYAFPPYLATPSRWTSDSPLGSGCSAAHDRMSRAFTLRPPLAQIAHALRSRAPRSRRRGAGEGEPILGRDLGSDFEHARNQLLRGRCLGGQRQLVIGAPPHPAVPLRPDLDTLSQRQTRHPAPSPGVVGFTVWCRIPVKQEPFTATRAAAPRASSSSPIRRKLTPRQSTGSQGTASSPKAP